MERELLITGCGRCGSKYISVLMRAIGLDIRHEQIGENGITSWYMAVDAKSVPIGPTYEKYSFKHTFQLVREPLAAIGSICSFSQQAWIFICQHSKCSMEDPILLRSAKYWYYWNQLAEQKADCFIRVEDETQIITTIERELGISIDKSVVEQLPKNVNTRRSGRTFHRIEELLIRFKLFGLLPIINRLCSTDTRPEQLSWATLHQLDSQLAQKIKIQAKEYGYEY